MWERPMSPAFSPARSTTAPRLNLLLTVGQDFTGSLTTTGNGGAIAITGNLTGTLNIGGAAHLPHRRR